MFGCSWVGSLVCGSLEFGWELALCLVLKLVGSSVFRFSLVESSVCVSLSLNEGWFVLSLSIVGSSVRADFEFDKSWA